MDGSAAFTKGKDGKEIWQDEGPLKGAKKNKDGSKSQEVNDWLNGCVDQRKVEVFALAD